MADLIGPYTIKTKDGTAATGWFEIIELPNINITYVSKGEKIMEVIIDKSSATPLHLFNNSWLSHYPGAILYL